VSLREGLQLTIEDFAARFPRSEAASLETQPRPV